MGHLPVKWYFGIDPLVFIIQFSNYQFKSLYCFPLFLCLGADNPSYNRTRIVCLSLWHMIGNNCISAYQQWSSACTTCCYYDTSTTFCSMFYLSLRWHDFLHVLPVNMFALGASKSLGYKSLIGKVARSLSGLLPSNPRIYIIGHLMPSQVLPSLRRPFHFRSTYARDLSKTKGRIHLAWESHMCQNQFPSFSAKSDSLHFLPSLILCVFCQVGIPGIYVVHTLYLLS